MTNKPKNKTKVLSAAEILAADDLPVRPVQIEEWGGEVLVRGMSQATYDAIMAEASNGESTDDMLLQSHMIAACVVENKGTDEEPDYQPMFDVEQAKLLRDKSVSAVGKLMVGIANVSGFGREVLAEAERTFLAGP